MVVYLEESTSWNSNYLIGSEYLMENKVVIVTGSTDGFGRIMAMNLMRRGARVVFHGRSVEKLRKFDEFDCNDENWLTVSGDIGNEADCKRLVDLTIAKFGRLDVLINNSVIVMKDSMSQYSLPIFDQLLSTNLHTIGYLSEICSPYLAKTRGQILNVNTLSAFFIFIQHQFADITKLAYEQFNRHCAKIYPQIKVQLLDPCPYFEEVLYLSDFCFTYKQNLHQWCKANELLEVSGQLEKLAFQAVSMLIK